MADEFSLDCIARLKKLDCCCVSDAMDKLQLSGVATGLPQQSGDDKIVGLAVTLKLGLGDPPPGQPTHLGAKAIEAATAANVIVIEQRSGVDAGSWGGLLTLGAKMRGVSGVVCDGPVRDLDEARRYQFPIFAPGGTARTARNRIVELGTNVPVALRGVRVDPGDYVIADRSGAAFIKPGDIESVLREAELIFEKEAHMARALLAGKSVSAVMGGDYEHMLKRS
jgi:regulator of RNase E activity RraA